MRRRKCQKKEKLSELWDEGNGKKKKASESKLVSQWASKCPWRLSNINFLSLFFPTRPVSNHSPFFHVIRSHRLMRLITNSWTSLARLHVLIIFPFHSIFLFPFFFVYLSRKRKRKRRREQKKITQELTLISISSQQTIWHWKFTPLRFTSTKRQKTKDEWKIRRNLKLKWVSIVTSRVILRLAVRSWKARNWRKLFFSLSLSHIRSILLDVCLHSSRLIFFFLLTCRNTHRGEKCRKEYFSTHDTTRDEWSMMMTRG